MKMIKLQDDVHALILRNCTKDMTIGEFLRKVVSGEPFVDELKKALETTKLPITNDLVQVAQWIVNEHKRRIEGTHPESK